MDIKTLAEMMHEKLCHWELTEQCSWWYENDRTDTWSEWEHARYLRKAQDLTDATGLPSDDIAKVIQNL